jgi:hypothetical protein
MKKIITATLFLMIFFTINGYSQDKKPREEYGKTFNLGIGIGGYGGYYRYVGRSLLVLNFNYEFDVAQNFTIAPFISFSSYSRNYYWGNKNYPHRNYYYREIVIPIGGKATYYFDSFLKASSDWDFYLAGSLGFVILHSSWEDGYYGDKSQFKSGNPLFLNLHIGTEYHINNRIGIFLDLSTGVSTVGLAVH